MQFTLYVQGAGPLILPLGYHHILQGCIYKILSSHPDFSGFLHDQGYQREGQSFRLFVYGLLKGYFQISESKIIFDNIIAWEIRSPVRYFCEVLSQFLQREESIEVAGQRLFLIKYNVEEKNIVRDEVDITTSSPICVDFAVQEGNKTRTRYLDPLDPRFNYYLTKNFQRKYQAVTGVRTDTGIFLLPMENFTPARSKYVTRFGGEIYITGWKGNFRLKGSRESLQFLYDTGLGSRNSQGFGMFQIVDR